MRRICLLLALATSACGSSATGSDAGAPAPDLSAGFAFPADELAKLKTLSPFPVLPPDTTNAHADDPAAATLGQKFFFDTGYSGPLGDIGAFGHLGQVGDSFKVSCNSCHMARSAF